jgi:hypothetical protein
MEVKVVERMPAMTPLWFARTAVYRVAVALALVSWGAVAVLAFLEPRQPADSHEQHPTRSIDPVP